MSNTSAISFSGSAPINFGTVELQILAVTSSNSPGNFTGAGAGINAIDCMVYNGGTNGAYVVFSSTAATAVNAAGSASGTAQSYIAPGAYVMLKKGQAAYFAAITDTSTTTLYLHAGRGA